MGEGDLPCKSLDFLLYFNRKSKITNIGAERELTEGRE